MSSSDLPEVCVRDPIVIRPSTTQLAALYSERVNLQAGDSPPPGYTLCLSGYYFWTSDGSDYDANTRQFQLAFCPPDLKTAQVAGAPAAPTFFDDPLVFPIFDDLVSVARESFSPGLPVPRDEGGSLRYQGLYVRVGIETTGAWGLMINTSWRRQLSGGERV